MSTLCFCQIFIFIEFAPTSDLEVRFIKFRVSTNMITFYHKIHLIECWFSRVLLQQDSKFATSNQCFHWNWIGWICVFIESKYTECLLIELYVVKLYSMSFACLLAGPAVRHQCIGQRWYASPKQMAELCLLRRETSLEVSHQTKLWISCAHQSKCVTSTTSYRKMFGSSGTCNDKAQ